MLCLLTDFSGGRSLKAILLLNPRLASGMAVHQPSRLLSLTVGGWCPCEIYPMITRINATILLNQLRGGEMPKEAGTGTKAPPKEMTAWVTEDHKPGLDGCWEAMKEGAEEAEEALKKLSARGIPVVLWAGDKDAPWEGNQALCKRNGWPFVPAEGGHSEVRMKAPTDGCLQAILNHITKGRSGGGGGSEDQGAPKRQKVDS